MPSLFPVPGLFPVAVATAALLVLGGCDSQPKAVAVDSGAAPEVMATSLDPVGRDGMTAIDAALGDGRAMPADSYAPSPYDLALREAAESPVDKPTRAASADPVPAPAARGDGNAIDLLGADDAVTVGG